MSLSTFSPLTPAVDGFISRRGFARSPKAPNCSRNSVGNRYGTPIQNTEKMGPYTRELAESLAKGMAFAIRSSGGEARIVFSDAQEPPPDGESLP